MRGWALTKALPMALLFGLTDATLYAEGGVWPPGTVFPTLAQYRSRARVRLRGRAIWLDPVPTVPVAPPAPVQGSWTSRGRLDVAMSLCWGQPRRGRRRLSVGCPGKPAGGAQAPCGRLGRGTGALAVPRAAGTRLGGLARRSRGWVRRRDETALLLALLGP